MSGAPEGTNEGQRENLIKEAALGTLGSSKVSFCFYSESPNLRPEPLTPCPRKTRCVSIADKNAHNLMTQSCWCQCTGAKCT